MIQSLGKFQTLEAEKEERKFTMNKADFYRTLASQIQPDDTWGSILTGNERNSSGFYELCATFASHTNSEGGSEDVIHSLREQVFHFCQKHGLTIDNDLFNHINQSYVLLLPPLPSDGEITGAVKEHWQEGGYAFEFQCHSTIPNEIWEAVFGNSMYE